MAYTLMFICTIWCVAFTISCFLICRPFTSVYHPHIVSYCDELLRDFVANVLNLGLDVVILSMPMPLLWGLQIPFKKKLALCALFGVGFG